MKTLLLFVLLCTPVFGGQDDPKPPTVAIEPIPATQEAKAVITDSSGNPPPTQVELGEPLFFSSKQSTIGQGAHARKWVISPQIRADRAKQFDNGEVLVVGTGTSPVLLRIMLIVAKGDTIDYCVVEVQCGTVPIPQPTPVVNPVVPPNIFVPVPTPQPTSTIKTQITAITASFANLPADQKPKVAAAFRAVAQQLATKQIMDTGSLLQKTTDAISGQIGISEFIKWYAWRDSITTYLTTLKYTNIAQHTEFWNAVADVLEGKP